MYVCVWRNICAAFCGLVSSAVSVPQLTEDWGEVLFSALKRAGGSAFSNMAVGYNNVDINAANKYGIAVGNTPVSFIWTDFTVFVFLAMLFLIWLVEKVILEARLE